MKIRQMEAELLQAGGQTDKHDEAKVAFRNLANAPKEILKKQKRLAWSGLFPFRTEDGVGFL
jgi:hypothetical protein